MHSISQFNAEVYDALTSNQRQEYTFKYKIDPGQNAIFILRQIQGGGLCEMKQFAAAASYFFETTTTRVRVF